MDVVGPRARTNRLVTRQLGDELVVYDLERHKAYCLNQVAMQVFRHCDGETTIPDMARRVGSALGLPVDEHAVRLGLVRLEKAHLLDGAVGLPFHTSRREMLRTMGRAAAVVVPLVTALAVPTSAHAAASGTCSTIGQSCQSDSDCGIAANLCHCAGPVGAKVCQQK